MAALVVSETPLRRARVRLTVGGIMLVVAVRGSDAGHVAGEEVHPVSVEVAAPRTACIIVTEESIRPWSPSRRMYSSI